jgi:hypothetical protein
MEGVESPANGPELQVGLAFYGVDIGEKPGYQSGSGEQGEQD